MSRNLQFITTLVVATACLSLSIIFPAQSGFQEVTKSIFFLVLVPALYIKFILKKSLSDFGLNLQNKKTGILLGIALFAILAILFLAFLKYTPLKSGYELPTLAVDNFWYFLFYELLFVNFFLVIYEFFFRGFVLFTLAPKLKFWAIPAQTIAFLATLFFAKSLSWTVAPAIAISLTSGILTYKTKSIAYAYLVALVFMFIFDAYLIYTIK